MSHYPTVAIHLNQHLRQCRMLGMQLVVRHGACPTGADALARLWCTRHTEVIEERYPAEKFGKWPSCGPKRNSAMVKVGANECVAFWDGKVERSGTLDTIAKATRAGIPVEVVPV